METDFTTELHRVSRSDESGGTLLHGDLTEKILRAAFEVHTALGPGLLESAYEACLRDELLNQSLNVRCQVELPIVYKGRRVDCGYRIDLIVEDTVIVEIKSVDKLAPIHDAQLLTYIRLSKKRVGLLFNFNVTSLRDGYRRRVI